MKRLIGGVLLAAGILIAGASGLCSLVAFFTLVSNGPTIDALGIVLLFDGIPLLAGLAVLQFGRSLLRRAGDD
jgi:hypothetical protein